MMNCKRIKRTQPLLREGLDNFSQDRQSPGLNSKSGPPEYESGVYQQESGSGFVSISFDYYTHIQGKAKEYRTFYFTKNKWS